MYVKISMQNVYKNKYNKYKTKSDELLEIIQRGLGGKKRKVESDPCDLIYWIVDIIGTMDLLKKIINKVNPDARVDEKLRTSPVVQQRRGKWYYIDSGLLANGLLFNAGHWYFFVDGDRDDSYNLNYQIPGTAHFCQTFATICYINKVRKMDSGFIPGDYRNNVIVCANFWIDLINRDKEIRDYLLRETSTYENGEETDSITGKKINLIKKGDLVTVFQYIIDNSDTILTYKEG